MESFSALLALCTGNSPVPGEFPSQRPVTRSFDVFFDLCSNKRLSKQPEAGDLRRRRTHSDVVVMPWIHYAGTCCRYVSVVTQIQYSYFPCHEHIDVEVLWILMKCFKTIG